MKNPRINDCISFSRAAELAGCTARNITRAIHAGELIPVEPEGSGIRCLLIEDVERWRKEERKPGPNPKRKK